MTNTRPASEKRKIREKPFIVKVFDRYIQTYTLAVGGAIFAEPKTPSIIQGLAFRSTPVGILGFGETKWHITALHEMVRKEEMNNEAAELYRRLKGMECEVEVKGLLRKDVIFKPHRDLDKLKEHIPLLKISDDLSKMLRQNKLVTDLIKTINPTEMSICLHSAQKQPQITSESGGALDLRIQKMVNYFKNPESITWFITLSTLFQEMPFVEKKADSVIQLFNEIFSMIDKVYGNKNFQ